MWTIINRTTLLALTFRYTHQDLRGTRTPVPVISGEGDVIHPAIPRAGPLCPHLCRKGAYTPFWVGNNGRGDWPECTGSIATVIIEPLD